MFSKISIVPKAGIFCCVTLFMGAAIVAPAADESSYKLKTLYTFCSLPNCADGSNPQAGLVMDQSGNLFGTTQNGSAHTKGNIFGLIPNAKKSKWEYKILYDFCAKANCADGAYPFASMILDTSGNLYGTTSQGGANNGGVVFELLRQGKHWKYKVLHDFCAPFVTCADGSDPLFGALAYPGAQSGALYDGTSTLYGTTNFGGTADAGTVFALVPSHGGKKWTEKIIYNFCSQDNCADGAGGDSTLIEDASGNLFGTTWAGGEASAGTAFELTSSGDIWTETVLHSFCQKENCSDGDTPRGTLAMDSTGVLFGVTVLGGVGDNGTIFKIIPSGADSVEIVLHNFCSLDGCADGYGPIAGPLLGTSGNLLGASARGGANSGGALFKLRKKNFSILYSPAESVSVQMLSDKQDNLFGIAGGGSVFKLTKIN